METRERVLVKLTEERFGVSTVNNYNDENTAYSVFAKAMYGTGLNILLILHFYTIVPVIFILQMRKLRKTSLMIYVTLGKLILSRAKILID